MKSTREILVDARALVARGWTRRAAARDANGNVCAPVNGAACAWCSIGALMAAADGPIWKALDALAMAICGRVNASIPRWNDAPKRTKDDVLDAFDRAIAACGEAA